MNTVWSSYIQSVGTLSASRALRFADCFREEYARAFRMEPGSRVLEIGCGPGNLAQALARWYPGSRITGIDRDSAFIRYARENTSGAEFLEGDATALPFSDSSFDVTIFNTVAEHIEPGKFYGEQYRVLKEGGICLVLSSRRGIHIPAPCVAEETEFEKGLWQRADACFRAAHAKYSVCAYPQDEAELPRAMESMGFRNVTTDYVVAALTPDDPRYPREMAHAMIDANRQNELDNAETMLRVAGEVVTGDAVERMKTQINARYDHRLRLYDKGIRQWDTDVSVTMVVRGVK